MPFSSGSFSVYTPGNPVVTGTTISSTVQNNTMTDFATGLSTCMLKDGSQTITSNIPMSNFKFTGLAAGSAAGDSLRYEQSFTSQTLTDAATISWSITAPQATVTITASRTMAAPTNQVAGGRYTLLVTQDGTGGWSLTWNAVFKAVGGGTMPQPETTAGAKTLFVFFSDGTNMYNAQCMPFIDTNYLVRGGTDPTKKLRFEVDGFTTGTTRVGTWPDRDITVGDLSGITNSLSGDVSLSNTSNYFDGPSVAQGTAGTWFASGTVTVKDTVGGSTFSVKMWDGTTVIASAQTISSATNAVSVSLSGFLTSPAGNIRISVKDITTTTGLISFNLSGGSKDSTITAIRIG